MRISFLAAVTCCLLLHGHSSVRAELLGYWSANSNGGTGSVIKNDQGNRDLDGELFGAVFTQDGGGHTGLPGDYAVSLPGEDDDYVVIPPTDETFEEFTITAWVNGIQNGDWAGLIVSRDGAQPIGLDFHAFTGMINYIWNDNNANSWNFMSDVFIPEDEWALVALTIDPDQATLYVGPKGGDLEFAVNEIPHLPQDNFSEWRWGEDDCCGGTRNFSGLMDDVSLWNEALTLADIERLHSGAANPLSLRGGGVPGDFDANGQLDAMDMNQLTAAVRAGTHDTSFDLNGDSLVNQADRTVWVDQLVGTYFGDSNLDGEFNSSDFVLVFQAGEYEDGVAGNSVWQTGDWDGDGDFSSSDFVKAFQAGGFEQGPRGAVTAVPEPSGLMALIAGAMFLGARTRASRR
jgi:hypothetical protein